MDETVVRKLVRRRKELDRLEAVTHYMNRIPAYELTEEQKGLMARRDDLRARANLVKGQK